MRKHYYHYYFDQNKKDFVFVTGGVLKDYLRALEQEPEDLIGQGDEQEVDEGHLYFCWKYDEKKYRMVE